MGVLEVVEAIYGGPGSRKLILPVLPKIRFFDFRIEFFVLFGLPQPEPEPRLPNPVDTAWRRGWILSTLVSFVNRDDLAYPGP